MRRNVNSEPARKHLHELVEIFLKSKDLNRKGQTAVEVEEEFSTWIANRDYLEHKKLKNLISQYHNAGK